MFATLWHFRQPNVKIFVMLHDMEIESILAQVTAWPMEEQVALAYEILREMRKQTREPAPRRTLDRALGVAAGTAAPPDDAQVRRWIEEHRGRKYG